MIVHADDAGTGLLELLIAATILTLVVGGVLSMLTGSQNLFESQQADMGMRQEARVALDKIVRETRGAGYDIGTVAEIFSLATTSALQFAADVDDGDSDPPCAAGFENAVGGGAERLGYAVVGTQILRSVDCWDGSSWTPEITSQVLVASVTSGQTVFRYFDETGAELLPGVGGLVAADRSPFDRRSTGITKFQQRSGLIESFAGRVVDSRAVAVVVGGIGNRQELRVAARYEQQQKGVIDVLSEARRQCVAFQMIDGNKGKSVNQGNCLGRHRGTTGPSVTGGCCR